MKIEINLELLIENELSPDDFTLIKMLASSNYENVALLKMKPNLEDLIENNWIEPIDWEKFKLITDIRLTKKSYDLLQIEISEEFYENIAQVFVDLWDGTKPGTISPNNAIIRKLKWFFREYEFNADTVKAAAAYYVSRENMNSNYKFLKSISNFIEEKDGQSLLYSYCLSIQQGDDRDSNLLV